METKKNEDKTVVIILREKKRSLQCDAKTRQFLDDDPTCKLGQREGVREGGGCRDVEM